MSAAHLPRQVESRLPLRYLVGFYRRQRRLMIALATIFTTVALLFAYSLHDRYVAATLLLLDQADAQLLDSKVNANWAETEVEMMSSDAIYRKVAIVLGLANAKYSPNGTDGDVNRPKNTPATDADLSPACLRGAETGAALEAVADTDNIEVPSRVTRALKKKIKVHRRGASDVIAVEATADSPKEAAMLSCVFTKVGLAEQVRSKLHFVEEVARGLSARKQVKSSGGEIATEIDAAARYSHKRLVEMNRDAVLPSIRVASWAVEPDHASFPQSELLAVIGVLAAIQAAVAIALVVDVNFTGISSQRELEMASGVWNIGLIPGAVPRRPGARCQDWIIERPSSSFSRGIHKLYNGVDLLLRQRQIAPSVMVTGMSEGVPHDAIAVALARSAALCGKKVVIVGAELVIVGAELQESPVPPPISLKQRGPLKDVSDRVVALACSAALRGNRVVGGELQESPVPPPISLKQRGPLKEVSEDAVALAHSAGLGGKRVVVVGGEPQGSRLAPPRSLGQQGPLIDLSDDALEQVVLDNLQTDPKSSLKVLSTKIGGCGWNDGMIHYSVFTGILECLERNFDLVVVVAPSLPQADNVAMQAVRTGLRLLVVQDGASMADEVTNAVHQLCRVEEVNVVTAFITL